MDQTVRRFAKKWLKLSECATNRILYAETKKGGLSLPRPSLSAPCSRIRAISSGRSVAIAKECIFSSDELRIALLTLILLQGADKLVETVGMCYGPHPIRRDQKGWTEPPKAEFICSL
jgi:hypothetical protein